MTRSRTFWLILVAALLLRLGVAWLAPHPGISDPNHYYNMARNLAQGRGFTIDYIWNYFNQPDAVTHPEDYWMPLPAVYPAVMLALFPDNLFAALLPAVLFGTAIVALTHTLAGSAGLSARAGLLAMLLVAFVPELVLNSARTDTTISYVFYVGLGALWLAWAFQRDARWFLGVGLCAGLAHLSRQDAILLVPALVVTLAGLRWYGLQAAGSWRWVWVIPLVWLLVLAPWMARNLTLFGVLLAGGASRTIFMTSFIDQFTYGRTLNLQHWLDWGIPNIVGNIAFQTLANVRMVFKLPTDLLSALGIVGLGLAINRSERQRWLVLGLPLVLGLGLFVFYSTVTPFHTQGGSFKKSVMLLLPFLAVMGAYVLDRALEPRIALALALMAALLMGMSALELVRDDFNAARAFDQTITDLTPRLQALGDVNGDGEIIVMTQDPFILNYHGFRALMLPSDPREMILAAARRYRVDYIILPAARVALDALYNQQETDERLRWHAGTGRYQLLEVVPMMR